MKVTIAYTLNDAGRKALLIAGGDGKAEQSTTIDIESGDIDLMSLAGDGSLSADARMGAIRRSSYMGASWQDHGFSAVPDAAELLAFLRARIGQRAQVEAAEAAAAAERKAAEAAADGLRREAAILALRQALTEGKIIQPTYGCLSINTCQLRAGDPDCGLDVQRMLDLAAAEAAAKSGHNARLSEIEAAARMPAIIPTIALPDGTYQFTCPDSRWESAWSKHLESIDSTAKNGYAFEGPWLRANSVEILSAGDLVIAGSKSWSGSKRRGEWVYSKELYIVTPAGLLKIADDEDCKPAAIKKLAQDIPERLEQSLKARAKTAREKLLALGALDRAVYAAGVADIDSRIAAWQGVLDSCQKALEAPAADEKITDIDSAAAAIVAAGYKALAKIHHPDAGITGSDATMALLSAARVQLRDMLKLAEVK